VGILLRALLRAQIISEDKGHPEGIKKVTKSGDRLERKESSKKWGRILPGNPRSRKAGA